MKRRLEYYLAFAKRQKKRVNEAEDDKPFMAEGVKDVVNDFDEYINELVTEIKRLRKE